MTGFELRTFGIGTEPQPLPLISRLVGRKQQYLLVECLEMTI